jgi:acetyl-CoA carboxylase biotin carboxyl carrier protein
MSSIPFDADTIQRLATILKESGLTELEMRDGEQHLRLKRDAAVLAAPPPTLPTAAPVVVSHAPPSIAAPVDEPPPPAGAVTSPMVGIAYLAPEAGAAPYVTVGQTVTAGQTVLLIEAMKTFNQIKAPHAGTVTQILVASGAPVEYGQPLLVIG